MIRQQLAVFVRQRLTGSQHQSRLMGGHRNGLNQQEVVQDEGTSQGQEESQRIAARSVDDPRARAEEREKGREKKSSQTAAYGEDQNPPMRLPFLVYRPTGPSGTSGGSGQRIPARPRWRITVGRGTL